MTVSIEEIKSELYKMGEKAVKAAQSLAAMTTDQKNICLEKMADALEANAQEIKEQNALDLAAGKENGLSDAMLDRLKLDDERIKGMAIGLREASELPDPVGTVLSETERPNGLVIKKVSVPIGVIGIIYESRPNVTADAAGLCLKAGNAVILRGGSEAIHSNLVIAKYLNEAGVAAGLPDGAVQLLPWTDRQAVGVMVKMDEYINLIIPRGGERLIKAVAEQSTIPVIKHYKGLCHLYVDASADKDMAIATIINSKCQRPGVCNAIETLLIHKDAAKVFGKNIAEELIKNGVEIRCDELFKEYCPKATIATEDDYNEEYLDLIISVRVVDSVEEAIEHINKYGSMHSESIISNDAVSAEKFLNLVDASTVYHNSSTRFTDGGEFGFGAEIGISTDKLHARGPMGLVELTTYKYKVYGTGQIR
ncbi:glutamate-5-semialdehyde dehydrogenase [Lentisphaerota bacterium WC36G]|nr:glutamate-5-semialdehyde dehydrogenase [Lentisphaerae bacterium WC36]